MPRSEPQALTGRVPDFRLLLAGFLLLAAPATAQVVSGTYTGNGSDDRPISGIGLTPAVVIIKGNTTEFAVIRTSSMSGDTTKELSAANALAPDKIQSLDLTGFTLGTHAQVNNSGTTYHYIAFQAVPGELTVGSYGGDGGPAQDITTVGFQPDYVIVLPASAQLAYQRSAPMAVNTSFPFTAAAGVTDAILTMLANGFRVGTNAGVNTNGTTYHYVAWRTVAGKMTFGSYVGNNTDNSAYPSTTLRPEYVIVKGNQATAAMHRAESVAGDSTFNFSNTAHEANNIQSILANGFQRGDDVRVNGPAANTYYWVAFGAQQYRLRSIGTGPGNCSAGMVSATNGSATITGSSTTWKGATSTCGRGDRITIDATDYTIQAVATDTQLFLTRPFTGATGSGKAFTIARKFATPATWDNCIDGPGPPTAACEGVYSASLLADSRLEVGIAYKDTAFTGTVTFGGATTSPTFNIRLTADPPNRHTGVRNTGVILSGAAADGFVLNQSNFTLEWFEVTGKTSGGVVIDNVAVTNVLITNMLVYGNLDGVTGGGGTTESWTLRNSFIFSNTNDGVAGGDNADGDIIVIENCTIFNNGSNAVDGNNSGGANMIVRNVIAMNNTGGNQLLCGSPCPQYSYVITSDGSPSTCAGNCQPGVLLTTNGAACGDPQGCVAVESITSGSENLHLKTSAYASRAVGFGLDLSGSFTRDIDDGFRPTGAGTWDIGADEFGGTTAVRLASFIGRGFDSVVLLEWETASELDNLGFHVYRSSAADGPWQRLTASFIPGLGSSPTGASYSYRDTGLENGTAYFYLLEDLEATGLAERHGPVSATPEAGGAGDVGGSEGDGGGSDDSGSGSGTGTITYDDPAGASLRVIEQGPSYAVLELLTPGFRAETQNDGTVRLQIPGFEETSLPGAPAVPLRRALVEALAGKQVRVTTVTPSDLLTFDTLKLTITGAPELEVNGQGAVKGRRATRSLSPQLRSGGYYPRHWARLVGSLFQGETKKAALELSPLRFDPLSGRTVLARRLLVRVEFSGADRKEISLGGSRGRRASGSVRSRGVVAQLVTPQAGLYRVRFEDVFGNARRRVPSASLRLSRRGQGVAYHLEPNRASFAPGSFLYFVNEGASNAYGDAVYELQLGKSAVRMPVVDGAPSGPITAEYIETREFEQNRLYQSGLLDAPDLWLWDFVASPATKSYSFIVDQLSPSSTPSHLRVVMQGASDFPTAVDHHLRASVNGIPVGEATWDGKLEQVLEMEVGPGILQEGSNTLALQNVGDAGASSSLVFVNRFTLRYPRRPEATGGRLEGRFDQSGQVEVNGIAAPAFVVDTTMSSWVKGAVPTLAGLSFRAEPGESYRVVSEASVLVPTVRAAVATSLRSPANRADWLLIAPKEFLKAAQPLVELRGSQGLKTKTVALEDVFAEFGYGEASPQAIKDFLTHAFVMWKKPSLKYVVLLGDSTYDPKDFLEAGVKDRIPAPSLRTTFLWTASDPTLAAVNGDDLVPDFAIGRLSAATVAEAETLVSKIVAFEQASQTLDGTAVLVADNADLAGNFEVDIDDAAQLLTGRDVNKVYLAQHGPAGTRAEIRGALEAGAGLLSYVGHGSTVVWASENVFNNLDLNTLSAQPQQPLLLTWNCLNGFFQFPYFDSLAEAFVKAPGKGAIAAFSPSGLSLDEPAQIYHRALLREIESRRHLRLGDAVLAAQQVYADSGAMPELLSIYHIFGDPALQIRGR